MKLSLLIELSESTRLDLTKLRDLFSKYGEDEFDVWRLRDYILGSFRVFDTANSNEIELDDARACIYSLNLCPTESEMQAIIRELSKLVNESIGPRRGRDKPRRAKVHFEKFASVLMPVLAFGLCAPKTNRQIRKAFELLVDNPQCAGFIELDRLQELIARDVGNPLRFNELEMMKQFLGEFVQDGKVYYPDYLKYLCVDKFDPKLFLKSKSLFRD